MPDNPRVHSVPIPVYRIDCGQGGRDAGGDGDHRRAGAVKAAIFCRKTHPFRHARLGIPWRYCRRGRIIFPWPRITIACPGPAVVMTKAGEARVVVRGETYEDLADRDV